MTTRLLTLPAILAALFAVLGCTGADATLNADEKQVTPTEKTNADVPQAPAPRAKKSQAELLIGTWRLVKLGKQPPFENVVYEFTKGGKYAARVIDPTGPPQRSTGTYEWQGNAIRLHAVATAEEPAESTDMVIELLTETELITASKPPDPRLRSVFKRVAKE